ncbi:MAG: SIS domain-containing protein [Armatimonadetes bacterium]|nr:SIS domain-containing protein [Armatimonadota bacterium]
MSDLGTNTLREILDQPDAWKAAAEATLSDIAGLKRIFDYNDFEEVIFCGCGSSHYLAMSAALTFQQLTSMRARALPASEIWLYPKANLPKEGRILFVPLSRSGETTEIVQALQVLKQNYNVCTLAISCADGSSLVQNADYALVSPRIREESIVMTGSFTSMLLICKLLAAIVAGNQSFIDQVMTLSDELAALFPSFRAEAERLCYEVHSRRFFFLGAGAYYGLACECALKMREMALKAAAEPSHPLELRHGPKSVVNEDTVVVCFISEAGSNYESVLLAEMRSYGATTVAIGDPAHLNGNRFEMTRAIPVAPSLDDLTRGLLYVPFSQLYSYHQAILGGINPDNPRNLTAVVNLA